MLQEMIANQAIEQKQLNESLVALQLKQSNAEKDAAKTKAIRDFSIQSLVVVLPYPVLLAIIWIFALSRVQPQWLAYLVSAVITLAVSFGVTRFLLSQAGKDQYVSQTKVLLAARNKIQLAWIVPFLLSAFWEIASKVLAEIANHWIFTPKP